MIPGPGLTPEGGLVCRVALWAQGGVRAREPGNRAGKRSISGENVAHPVPTVPTVPAPARPDARRTVRHPPLFPVLYVTAPGAAGAVGRNRGQHDLGPLPRAPPSLPGRPQRRVVARRAQGRHAQHPAQRRPTAPATGLGKSARPARTARTAISTWGISDCGFTVASPGMSREQNRLTAAAASFSTASRSPSGGLTCAG
jgi:hypothetical protein